MSGPPAARPAAFVDSSALVALADSGDRSHAAAVAAYRDLLAGGYRLFTTDLVVAEAFDLLRVSAGPAVARNWLRSQRLPVYRPDDEDLSRARALLLDPNAPPHRSHTDAVSLAVMERLGVSDAFAVDPNFLAGAS